MEASCRCKKCNRPLKNPKSIEIGMGKICAAKAAAKEGGNQTELFDFDRDRINPIPNYSNDIELTRLSDGTAEANIPRRIIFHSPTGFEWGYGGSGPGDLALNILSMFVSQEEAYRLHQPFKWDFIAPMKHSGGTISNATIREWINSHVKEVA